MKITLVKKIKSDGTPCRKCVEVEQRLEEAGLSGKIDQIAIADESDPQSDGMLLAKQHRVELAPFFIVEDDQGNTKIYTIYFRFVKEVLSDEQKVQKVVA